MYSQLKPTPLIIKLTDEQGYKYREKAAEYIATKRNTTGAERGSSEEQGFGALAEIVVRDRLGLPQINNDEHPLAFDLKLPSGVKVDVKCRGGSLPFREEYESSDGTPRESKHNFFARQVFDSSLDTDIYLLTHLETPSKRVLPGTKRQRKWVLYVCGWVSKVRVAREGVYLPRQSLTEQGNTWFTYRGQEIEFYHRYLNGLARLEDLPQLEKSDVDEDAKKTNDLNLTKADAIRIAYDLVGRGVLSQKQLSSILMTSSTSSSIKPILHPNQYFHLLAWLKSKGIVGDEEIEKLRSVMKEEPYTGI